MTVSSNLQDLGNVQEFLCCCFLLGVHWEFKIYPKHILKQTMSECSIPICHSPNITFPKHL